MSLIQEALRRQQEEASRQQQGSGPAQPPADGAPAGQPQVQPPAVRHMSLQQPKPPAVPPDLPAETASATTRSDPAKDSGKGSSKPRFGVAAVLVLILLLAAGLAFGGWRLYTAWIAGRAAGGSPEEPAADTNAAALTGEAAGVTDDAPSSAVDVAAVPAGVVTTEPAPVVSTGDTPTTTPESIGPSAPGTAVVHRPVAPAAPPKPKWPSISLSGFVGRGESGTAILNGQMIAVGESISGVEVRSIERRAVRLRFAGETRVLNQGQTTEP